MDADGEHQAPGARRSNPRDDRRHGRLDGRQRRTAGDRGATSAVGSPGSSGPRTRTCSRSARCCSWRARWATCSARGACSPSAWPGSGSRRCSARWRRPSSCSSRPARSRACSARCSRRAALAVIVANFPPDERGRAVGAWTAWGGIGTVLGPLIGGQLVDTASWRWIFAINVPIVLITLFLVLRVVPEGEGRAADAKVDVIGATLCALGLGGITYGLISQPLHGWGAPGVAVPLVAGAILFASFVVWEARSAHPMLPLGAVPAAQLRGGQHRDVLDVRGAGAAVLLPRPVPAAGGGLLGARGGHDHDPGDARDVPVLRPLRRAGRPPRAALLHGRGAAGGGRGARVLPASRRRRRLRHRSAARAADLLGGAGDDGGAAHRDRAGRRGRAQRRHRVGREQRDRARGEPDRDRGRRRGGGIRVRVGASRRARRPGASSRGCQGDRRGREAAAGSRGRRGERAAARCGPRWRGARRTLRSRHSMWPSASPPHSWRWAAFSA